MVLVTYIYHSIVINNSFGANPRLKENGKGMYLLLLRSFSFCLLPFSYLLLSYTDTYSHHEVPGPGEKPTPRVTSQGENTTPQISDPGENAALGIRSG